MTIRKSNLNLFSLRLAAMGLSVLLFSGCGTEPRGVAEVPKRSAEPREGEAHIDMTPSIRADHRRATIEALGQDLVSMTQKWHVTEWAFYGFSDDGWLSRPFYKINVPQFTKPECEQPHLSDRDKIRKGQTQAKEQKARMDCEEATRSASDKHLDQLKTIFDEATSKVLGQPIANKSRCTAVWDALMGLAMKSKPTVAIVLTDGKEECLKGDLKEIPAPKGSVEVFMILLPTESDSASGLTPAQQFGIAREKWLKIAPWVKILSPSALNFE
jgi:hypothetical protein